MLIRLQLWLWASVSHATAIEFHDSRRYKRWLILEGNDMRSVTIGLVLTLVSSSLGMAAPVCGGLAGCACAVPLTENGSIGKLSDIVGDVLLASPAGYSPVTSPTGVALGDQVTVKEGGAALLSLGPECQLSLSGPEKIRVKAVGECACAKIEPPAATAGGGGAAGALVVGGLAVGGVAALIATSNGQPSP